MYLLHSCDVWSLVPPEGTGQGPLLLRFTSSLRAGAHGASPNQNHTGLYFLDHSECFKLGFIHLNVYSAPIHTHLDFAGEGWEKGTLSHFRETRRVAVSMPFNFNQELLLKPGASDIKYCSIMPLRRPWMVLCARAASSQLRSQAL